MPGLIAASVWMTSSIGRPVLPLLISLPAHYHGLERCRGISMQSSSHDTSLKPRTNTLQSCSGCMSFPPVPEITPVVRVWSRPKGLPAWCGEN